MKSWIIPAGEMGGFDATQIESTIGGYPGYSQLCAGSVVSMAVVPNPTLGVNDIWLVVLKASVDGAVPSGARRSATRAASTASVVLSSSCDATARLPRPAGCPSVAAMSARSSRPSGT